MDEKVISVLKEAMDNGELDVQLSDSFRDYEEWDSLAYLSMIAALDEEFGVEIEDDDFGLLVTVEDLINTVRERAK